LLRSQGIRCESRVQFFALCAQIIRRILVDYARNRGSAKRGGGAVQIPIDETLLGTRMPGIEVLALNEPDDDQSSARVTGNPEAIPR